MFSSYRSLRKNSSPDVYTRPLHVYKLLSRECIHTSHCHLTQHTRNRLHAAGRFISLRRSHIQQAHLRNCVIPLAVRTSTYPALALDKYEYNGSDTGGWSSCVGNREPAKRQLHFSQKPIATKKRRNVNHCDQNQTNDKLGGTGLSERNPSGPLGEYDAVWEEGPLTGWEGGNSRYNTATETTSSASALPTKVDLSYYNTRQKESTAFVGSQSDKLHDETFEFRDKAGLRAALRQYMLHINPFIGTSTSRPRDTQKLNRWLAAVFSPLFVQHLQQQGFVEEDLASWSWILGAKTVALSIRRYVTLARRNRDKELTELPSFLPLQLLRARQVDSHSLHSLIQEVENGLDRGMQWDSDAGSVLLIRLLRHARLVDITCFERIAKFTPRILPLEISSNLHNDLQRLTHFYNRFLSLLALPAARHPFLSVGVQQAAQLKIVRTMLESSLQVPLNREGYRALARVQLMHEKTAEERQWSSTKAQSWPPWRHDELGIDAKLEYPGRHSRVSKVIKRLLAAGYGPESVELELQILSGWDTDKSPTIQTRRIVGHRALSWFKNTLKDQGSPENRVDPCIWAARVTSTRSIREAWICFYSYLQATTDQKRELRVYIEMFYKLLARVQLTDQKHIPAPGDGKEVFPDPSSPRDLVYVPEEPLSKDELYAQMIQDGIQPAGRLLPLLIDNAPTIQSGYQYIHDSSIGDVKKDVLLRPENYPIYVIQNVYKKIPHYLLTSYLGLVTRQTGYSEAQLFWPGSRSTEEQALRRQGPVKPLEFGMVLLQYWNPTYIPAYHAVLEGICVQSQGGREDARYYHSSHSELWKAAKNVLALYEGNGLQFDLMSYRKTVMIFRNYVIRAPLQVGSTTGTLTEAVTLVKTVFLKAIRPYSDNSNKLELPRTISGIGQQPYWKDIEALILMMGFDDDFASIIDVLRWMHQYGEGFDFVGENEYRMHRITCAVRVALEALWAKDQRGSAAKAQIEEAMKYSRKWGWPDDVDVEEYLHHHQSWFDGMRAVRKYSNKQQ